MDNKTSIFDLERRSDLKEDYNDFIRDINDTYVITPRTNRISIYDYLNDSIKEWPFRDATSNIDGYLSVHEIDKEQILYIFELYYNLLKWAPIYNEKKKGPFDAFDWDNSLLDNCNRIIENIDYILELNNYCVYEKPVGDNTQYRLRKRDVDVDSVIETVPELSEVLLSYLDIRTENNEKQKTAILKELADYLEPRRKEYNNTMYSSLCNDVFAVFNKCNIRHNDKKQIKIEKSKRMQLYDDTFKMCIHLLQMKKVNEYKLGIAELGVKESKK